MRQYGFTACERGVVDACKINIMDEPFLMIIILVIVFVLFLVVKSVIQGNREMRDAKTEITIIKKTVVFYGLCGVKYSYLTICKFQLDNYISEGWILNETS